MSEGEDTTSDDKSYQRSSGPINSSALGEIHVKTAEKLRYDEGRVIVLAAMEALSRGGDGVWTRWNRTLACSCYSGKRVNGNVTIASVSSDLGHIPKPLLSSTASLPLVAPTDSNTSPACRYVNHDRWFRQQQPSRKYDR